MSYSDLVSDSPELVAGDLANQAKCQQLRLGVLEHSQNNIFVPAALELDDVLDVFWLTYGYG